MNEDRNIAEKENNDGKIAEIVEQFGEDCQCQTHCDNIGQYSKFGNDPGSPIEECEWCIRNPYSKYNLRIKIIELIRADRKELLTEIKKSSDTGILVTRNFNSGAVHLRASSDIRFVELQKVVEILSNSNFAV
ncbi:MAG: hypothetical protein SCALA702_00310 [Melioribacteraceae bacterium]|nr:MAG: hypothetical protein SCALA702_00310 [Melioribacteraceae bacterium]